jgi:hypothetical protein
MDNATKNKLVSGTDQADLTSGNACWETPPLVFSKLSEDFGPFDVDLTADARRHLCPTWFGPQSNVHEHDALLADWNFWGKSGYSNPPYGPFIQQLLPHAKAMAANGFSSALLLPMRVTKAFKAHILNGASDLLFCDSRVTFFENGIPRLNEKNWIEKGRAVADPAVFDSIIVRYRPGVTTLNVGIWEVPKHVTADNLARAIARRREAA